MSTIVSEKVWIKFKVNEEIKSLLIDALPEGATANDFEVVEVKHAMQDHLIESVTFGVKLL